MVARGRRPTTGQLVRRARDLRIVAALESGLPGAEVARQFGISAARVSQVYRREVARTKNLTVGKILPPWWQGVATDPRGKT